MKERPILFQGAMVRALLPGTKTQTRRLVKWRDLEPGLNLAFTGLEVFSYVPGLFTLEAPTRTGWERRSSPTTCPYGLPGDRLWVREAFNRTNPGGTEGVYFYRADSHFPQCIGGGPIGDAIWKPSIHMPRAASRILLEVTGVRVERLKAISEADALAEGVEYLDLPIGRCFLNYDSSTLHELNFTFTSAIDSYRTLWNSINGAGSWDANPSVWVVEFRRIQP